MKKIIGTVVGLALLALPAVSFAAVGSNVTATAGTGATVSPAGSVFVVSGVTQTFLAGAATGYTLSNVSVDGVAEGAVSSVDVTGDAVDHTIDVSAMQNVSFGGDLIYGSSPLAPGWDASKHTNYITYNGTTCVFSQGCMMPH